MINKESIIFKSNVIVTITLLSIVFIFGFAIIMYQHKVNQDFFEKGLHTHNIISILPKYSDINIVKKILKENKYILIEKNKDKVLKNGIVQKDIIEPKPPMDEEHRFHRPPPHFEDRYEKPHHHIGPPVKIIKYMGQKYIHLNHLDLLVKSTDNRHKTIMLIIVSIGILILSLLIYSNKLLRNNLMALKNLHLAIIKYSNGQIDKSLKTDKKDEISVVSNEFYNTVIKVDKLQESRKFLMRNMMHELKTPLTKSKLYLAFLENESIKDKLENSLNKLELLINEMANIEKISSSNITLVLKPFRIGDIIDDAIDSLFLEKKIININIESNKSINVDFKLFSIAIKNLIDNGIKYSTDKQIQINCNNEKISVISKGKKLKHNFHNYIEPFFKGDLNSVNQKGFGLGLYIVNEIVNKHNFIFGYDYQNENNIFYILIKGEINEKQTK